MGVRPTTNERWDLLSGLDGTDEPEARSGPESFAPPSRRRASAPADGSARVRRVSVSASHSAEHKRSFMRHLHMPAEP